MRKYAYGALLLSGLLTLQATQTAIGTQIALHRQKQEAQKILREIDKETVEQAARDYRRSVDALASGLGKDFSLLISATWCVPCANLEEEMRGRGQATDHRIIADTAPESAYLRSALAGRGIPAIENVPTLIVSRRGVVTTYRGYDRSKHAMFTDYGTVTLEEILKK